MSTCLLTYQQSVFKCSTYKMAAKINWHRYGRKLRHCHPMYIIYKFNRFTKRVARMCQQTCKLVTNIDFPFSVDPTDPGSHTDKTSTEQIFTQNKQCSNQPTKHWHNWHDFYLTFPDFWSIPWHFQVSQTSGVVWPRFQLTWLRKVAMSRGLLLRMLSTCCCCCGDAGECNVNSSFCSAAWLPAWPPPNSHSSILTILLSVSWINIRIVSAVPSGCPPERLLITTVQYWQ